jgi:hypothetical protein
MSHPFALNLSDLETVDLEFEEHLNSETDAQVEGGILPGGCVITKGCYEGGGYPCPPPYPGPCYEPPVYNPCPKPPVYTTMALGEEGGCGPVCW